MTTPLSIWFLMLLLWASTGYIAIYAPIAWCRDFGFDHTDIPGIAGLWFLFGLLTIVIIGALTSG